jgi:hypothetical protein
LYFNITIIIAAHTKHTITNSVTQPWPSPLQPVAEGHRTLFFQRQYSHRLPRVLSFLFLFSFLFYKHNTTILFHSAAATRRHIMVHRHDVLEEISAPLGTRD